MFKSSLFNLFLRSVTLGSKFFLILMIARTLKPEDLGLYGLMAGGISVGIYVLGMEYHTFNSREIVTHEGIDQSQLVNNQLALHFIAYLLVLPLIAVIYSFWWLRTDYLPWFLMLIIIEHLSQELYRMLIAFSRPDSANIVLFVRAGAWVYALLLVWIIGGQMTLSTIWAGWLTGGVLSVCLGVRYLLRLHVLRLKWETINWGQIGFGLRVSSFFFVSSLAIQVARYVDKLTLSYFLGQREVGIYTFFASLTTSVEVLVYSGVVILYFPKVLKTFQQNRAGEFVDLVKKMGLSVAIVSTLVALALAIAINPLISMVGQPVYRVALPVFAWLIAGIFLYNLSLVPHYVLYAAGRDKLILWSSLCLLLVTAMADVVLVPRVGMVGAGYAILIANSCHLVLKSVLALLALGSRRSWFIQRSVLNQ